MKKLFIGACVFAIICLGMWWLNRPFLESLIEKEPPLVLASNGLVADAVNQLLASNVRVETLISDSTMPYKYTLSIDDVEKVDAADVIVVSGLGLEGDLVKNIKFLTKNKRIISLADGVPKKRLITLSDQSIDPHFWHDLTLWVQAIQYLAKELKIIYPRRHDEINYLSQIYERAIIKMHQEIVGIIMKVPSEKRRLFTEYDMFRYFARGYNVTVFSIHHGLNEYPINANNQLHATLDVNALIALLKNENITNVFSLVESDQKLLNMILEESLKENWVINVSSELFGLTIQKGGHDGYNFLSTIRYNIQMMVDEWNK